MKSNCEGCGHPTQGPNDTLCAACWKLITPAAKKEFLRVWWAVQDKRLPAAAMVEADRFLGQVARGEVASLAHVQAGTTREATPPITHGFMADIRAFVHQLVQQRDKFTRAIDALNDLFDSDQLPQQPPQIVALPSHTEPHRRNAPAPRTPKTLPARSEADVSHRKERTTSHVQIRNAILAFLRSNEGPQEMAAIRAALPEHGVHDNPDYQVVYNSLVTLRQARHIEKVGSAWQFAGEESEHDESGVA